MALRSEAAGSGLMLLTRVHTYARGGGRRRWGRIARAVVGCPSRGLAEDLIRGIQACHLLSGTW